MAPPAAVDVVAGTRPEFAELAPLVSRLVASSTVTSAVVHTGQHYDNELSDACVRDLDRPAPDHVLGADPQQR